MKFTSLSVALLATACIFAQPQHHLEILRNDNHVIQAYAKRISPTGTLYFRAGLKVDPHAFIMDHRAALGLTSDDQFELISTHEGQPGEFAHRYQQMHRGLPVVGGEYLIHTKDGELTKLRGRVAEGLNLGEEPMVHEDTALAAALQSVDALVYAWDVDRQAKKPQDANMMPRGERVIIRDPNAADDAPSYRVAYAFDINTVEPSGSWRVFVDGETGALLQKLSNRYFAANDIRSGQVLSVDYGTRHLTISRCAPWYILFDPMRNLHAKNSGLVVGENFAAAPDYQSSFLTWSDLPGPMSLWVIQRAYEYFEQTHWWAGIDRNNQYTPIYAQSTVSFYQPGVEYIAIANGQETLDIGGHEFTHGIIDHSSRLLYVGESAALAESFADIFGVMTETFTLGQGQHDWLIGEDSANTLRSLQDPTIYNDPDTYQGQYWQNTNCGTAVLANDFCGASTNSGVQNKWFYLLSDGGTHNGVTVQGIGRDKAARIAFRNMTVELLSTSDYFDAREGAIDAAEIYYGECSNEVTQTINAWAAVGVGATAGACTPTLNASAIDGPSVAPPGYLATWSVTPSGGVAPYTYEWRINGTPVGTGSSYSMVSPNGSFSLAVTVRDASLQNEVRFKAVTVCSDPAVCLQTQ